jgi:tetratricopeptide (TPR) repeat protein
MAYGNRGGYLCAGLLACAAATFSQAQTNAATRARDDKSSFINLAVQAVQQVQAQGQVNLLAIHETRKEVASLRRLTLLVGAGLGAGMFALALYARNLLRSYRQRAGSASLHVGTETLLRRAAGFEQSHRLEEALACYEQVLALDASLTEAYVGKGRVLNQLERYREALDCFEQASRG